MPDPKLGKTGQAPHIMQGQTTDGRFATDPEIKGRPASAKVRELHPR